LTACLNVLSSSIDNLEPIVKQPKQRIYPLLAGKTNLLLEPGSVYLSSFCLRYIVLDEGLKVRAEASGAKYKARLHGPVLGFAIGMLKCCLTDFMLHQNTLELTRSALAIIDMQEAFRAQMADFAEVAERIAVMVQGARLLGLPIIVTEQYPNGLGHTAKEIAAVLPDGIEVIEKTTFSSCGVGQFQAQLAGAAANQVIVCGIEAHICVNQTVHDLLAGDYQVHLLTDCITSRHQDDKKTAVRKMQRSGAVPCSVEMALFELMRDARHEQFKAIQKLIK
jgi:nicotinamidase-related amidase